MEALHAGKYTTAEGDGAFSPADAANTLYYPTQDKKADIVAYYPYTAIGADLMVPVSVADQSKLSEIDFMVADKVTGKNASDSEVSLTFRHKLVKLDLSVDCTASASGVDLSAATIALYGTPATAQWDLATDSLTAGKVTADSIAIPAQYSEADKKLTATAIVIPCDAEGVKLVITAGNHSYDVAFTSDMALKAGTKNTLRVHLSYTEATVEASVADWTTGVEADLQNLKITTSGTADDLTDNSAFTALNLFVNALDSTSYAYTKSEDGAWTSTSPLYLDELPADAKLYAQATQGEADAVTALTDALGTDATEVKGGTAALAFRHLLAQMSINLAAAEGFVASLDSAVVTTPAMIKDYTVGIDAEGHMAAVAGTETQAYTLADTVAHLVVPQTLAANSVFTVKLANGNTYTAALAEAVTLTAGKHTTVTLTLQNTAAGVKVAVTDWGTAAAAAAVRLAGLTDGTVTYAANEGDALTVYYNEVGSDAISGSFKYEEEVWTVNTPLYWDEMAQDGFTKQFIAVLTPADKTAPFADFFVGKATDVTYGSEVTFTLQHAAAQLTFQIEAGTGIADLATEVPTRTLTLGAGEAAAVNADGTIDYGTLADTDYTIAAEALYVTPQTLAETHVVTLTRANGNKYVLKLADLKDSEGNALFADGKLEAGKHYTITLTVNESTVGIKASIAAWTEVSGSGTLTPQF